MERDEGFGPGAPHFAMGFVLPSIDVETKLEIKSANTDMIVKVCQAGV